MSDIKIGGTAPVKIYYFYTTKYGVGAVVYVVKKAQKGILEKIVIKKPLIGFNPFRIVYLDTFNEPWLEYELCTQTDAIAAATNFLQKQEAKSSPVVGKYAVIATGLSPKST